MARSSPTERARIRAALEAHARDSKDLSVSAYARAAGVTRETARNYIAKQGLPSKGDPSIDSPVIPPVPPSSSPAATVAEASAPAGPVDGANDLRALVDRLVAQFQTLPPAVGQEVRMVLSEIVALKGVDADEAAVHAARVRLVADHTAGVTATAAQIYADDVTAGEAMRRYWLEHGLSGRFSSPGELVKSALAFWWQNEDVIADLRERLGSYETQFDEVRRLMDVELARREAHDRAWTVALTAAVSGNPLPREILSDYIRLAESEALADVARVASSPVVTALVGGG